MLVGKAPNNSAFAFEALLAAFPHPRKVEEFHRHPPLEATIASFGQPHASHATLADLRDQRVWSQCLACEPRSVRQLEAAILQKAFLRQQAMFVEECHQLRSQRRILLAQ